MDDDAEWLLWLWLAGEIGLLLALFALLSASLLGETSLTASFSRPLRAGALAFVTVELMIPLVVYLDLRRRTDEPGTMWLHAAAMPLVNVLGFLAYLEERRREA